MATPEEALEQIQKDYQSLKKRRKKDIEEAEHRGREEVILGLIELVDDCDRALSMMYSTSELGVLTKGMEQLRNQTINRFERLGVKAFGSPGEKFNPHIHDAIAVVEVPGPSGMIVSVHSLGWQEESGQIVKPAMVTVSKELTRLEVELEVTDANLSQKIISQTTDCFFGNEGCQNHSCPECRLKLSTGGQQ